MKKMDFEKYLVDNFHREAMDLAEKGLFLIRSGKLKKAIRTFKAAFFLESKVANALINSKKDIKDIEPSRTITCMSAAQLAKDAGMIEEAKKYAQKVIDYNLYNEYVVDAQEIMNL